MTVEGVGRPSQPTAPGPPGRELFAALGRSIINAVTFGGARRTQRALNLVPGEVIVGWLPRDDAGVEAGLAKLHDRFLTGLYRWTVAGAGRTRAKTELSSLDRPSRPDQRPSEQVAGEPAQTWLLRCRPGTERELVDVLIARAQRWERQGRALWRRGTFVATRVPWLRVEAAPALAGRLTLELLLPTIEAEHRGFERRPAPVGRIDTPDGSGIVIGILDSGLDLQVLAEAGVPVAQVDVQTWGQGPRGEALVRMEKPAPPTGLHGSGVTAVIATLAPGARIEVVDLRETLPTLEQRQEVAGSWILHALYQFENTDLINMSVSVDVGGQQYAPYFEMHCAQLLEVHARKSRPVVIAAAGNLRAPTATTDEIRASVDHDRPSHRHPAWAQQAEGHSRMAYPARDLHAIGVGSLANGRPWSRNRRGGKLGDLHWLAPGGTEDQPLGRYDNEPIYGTSFATAVFTATLARLIAGPYRPPNDRDARADTLRRVTNHTHPLGTEHQIWGRGTLRPNSEWS